MTTRGKYLLNYFGEADMQYSVQLGSAAEAACCRSKQDPVSGCDCIVEGPSRLVLKQIPDNDCGTEGPSQLVLKQIPDNDCGIEQ